MLGDVRAVLGLTLVHFAAQAAAQAYHGFQWKFGGDVSNVLNCRRAAMLKKLPVPRRHIRRMPKYVTYSAVGL